MFVDKSTARWEQSQQKDRKAEMRLDLSEHPGCDVFCKPGQEFGFSPKQRETFTRPSVTWPLPTF